MKFIGTAIACFFLTTFIAENICGADARSHRQALEELFVVTHMEETINAVSEQLIEMQIRQNPVIAPYRETIREFLKKYISWDSMRDDIAELYMKEFTEQETREIASFYKTPAGQKVLQLLPTLLSKSALIGQKRVQAHFGELQRMISDKAGDLNQTR